MDNSLAGSLLWMWLLGAPLIAAIVMRSRVHVPDR